MAPKKKRYALSTERRIELSRTGSVYIITCNFNQCTCFNSGAGCLRGFFSLFIQVVYGIDFAKRHQLPWYVDFGDKPYAYLASGNAVENIWDYYFDQHQSRPKKKNQILNRMIEVYPLRIWHRRHFRKMHAHITTNLQLKKTIGYKIEQVRTDFQNQRILRIQVRGTDHHVEVPPVPLSHFWHRIDRKRKHFDRLFIATDDLRILKKFEERYGDWLLYHTATRSEDESAIHFDSSGDAMPVLGEEVLIDCYSLAFCKEAILIHSNISYCALFFNPALRYTLLEQPESRKKRWKTLLVYLLDQWGIRKF